MTATRLIALPVSQVGILSCAARYSGGDVIVEYQYETVASTARGLIRFENAARFRFANESHSEPYPAEAYDAVAEVTDSAWLLQSVAPGQASPQWPFARRHFSVFLSNCGHLEVIAERFDSHETTEPRS